MSSPLMFYQQDPKYKRRYAFGQNLLQQGSQTTPVQHPMQALARVAQALSGAYIQRGADREIEGKLAQDRQLIADALSKLDQPSDYQAPRPSMIVEDPAAMSEDPQGAAHGEQPLIPGQADTRLRQMAGVLGGSQNPALMGLGVNASMADFQAKEKHRRALEVARQKAMIDLQVAPQMEAAKQRAALPFKTKLKQTPPRYTPVQNIGLYDNLNKQWVGYDGAAAPGAVPGAVPGAPAQTQKNPFARYLPQDPVAKLPPFQAAKAVTARMERNSKAIEKSRTALATVERIEAEATKFEEIMKRQPTGGWLRIPGAAKAAGVVNADIDEMNAIVDRTTPIMRQGLPGAASDRDVAMFRGGLFGPGKLPATNLAIIRGFKISAQNARDYIDFQEHYMGANNGRLDGGKRAWRDYLNKNQIFDHTKAKPGQPPPLNMNRKTWREHFGLLQLPSHGPSGAPVNEANIADTMRIHGMTRTQVLQQLGVY